MQRRLTGMTEIKNANIEEELPDAIDLAMLEEMKHNPDCYEFVSSEEAMKMLGI